MWFLIALLTLVWGVVPAARAQGARDSITLWTRALQTASLSGRDSALSGLSNIPISDLPPDTKSALIGELNRLHAAMLSNTDVGPADGGDLLGEYYMQLVGTVASIRTQEAGLALAPAVGVSSGVARRVARLGDPAVGVLLPLLARRHEVVAVLQTLGLAWFWADSTGGPLSDLSRSRIVSAFTTAADADSLSDLIGLAEALREVDDPAFLPLAIMTRDRTQAMGNRGAIVARELNKNAIVTLSTLVASRSTSDLVKGTARIITAVCGENTPSHRTGVCQSITNDFPQATRHLDNQETAPAHDTLESVAKKIDKAYTDGAFSPAERALLAGNVTVLLGRIAP